jgi:hypothetical protein
MLILSSFRFVAARAREGAHPATSSTIIGSGPFASRAQARTTRLYKPSFLCNFCRKLLANSKRQQARRLRPVL